MPHDSSTPSSPFWHSTCSASTVANHEVGRHDERILRALYLLTRDFESRPLEKPAIDDLESKDGAATDSDVDAGDVITSGVHARGRVPRP